MLEEVRKKKKGPVTILVTGKTGTGKSTLVNGLVGKQVAREGEDLEGVTREVEDFPFEKNGIPFIVFDSPGLQDANIDDTATLKQISDRLRAKCGAEVDLLVYCLNMTNKRIDRSDISAIYHLTQGFSAKLWKNAVFVLTFANKVHIQDETSFKKQLAEFESVIKKHVREQIIQVNVEDKNVADTIPFVPAGYWRATKDNPNPLELPDRKNWFGMFWFTCAKRMNEVSGVCLMLSQAGRIKLKSQTSQDKPVSQCSGGNLHEQPIVVDDGDWLKFFAAEGVGAGIGGIMGSSGFTGAVTVAFKGIEVVAVPFTVAGGLPGIIVGSLLGLAVASIAYVMYRQTTKK